MNPKQYFFKNGGKFPNNKLPLLLYKNVLGERGEAGAAWLEKRFRENNWRNSWRNGVYNYHHYHSNTHEVLGVYAGKASLLLGGEEGETIEVEAGDVLVIPAGVAHKNLASENLQLVGAYPNGMEHDMNYGKEEERPAADEKIAAVPLPEYDPLQGEKGLPEIWKNYAD